MTGFAYLDEVAGDPGGVLAFAHRGGAYHPEIEGLENTMAAFKHAIALGYDYLETDVHVTSDGVLLAFHDAVLDRVTDVEGAIADLSFEEVRQALVGGREQVPTLAQLFDEFPRARFNIDLKSEGAVPVLAEFIEEREAWDRVLVGSFSPQRMSRVPPAHRAPSRDVRHTASRSPSSASCPAHGSRTGSPASGWPPSRSRTSAGAGPSPVPGWYAVRMRRASMCTSGPSTTPRR